jgi:predicted nucleic acid-binding protein
MVDEKSTTETHYLILDTNVFQHFSNPDIAIHITKHLKEAIEAGYTIALSEFSFFELVDGATPKIEEERLNTTVGVKCFEATKDVLMIAAHLGCMYQDDGHTVKDIGDKIIGSTALMTDSLIYTFNGRDFPTPFFAIVATRYAEYTNKGVPTILAAHFIKPEPDFISKRYDQRITPASKK